MALIRCGTDLGGQANLKSGVDGLELHAVNTDGDAVIANGGACVPGPVADPCPDNHVQSFDIDLGDLPEGETTFVLKAKDYTGNTTEAAGTNLSWKLNIDRTSPTIEATGDLFDLSGEWTNESDEIKVDLSATDDRSGVYGVELHAVNSEGSTLLASKVLCSPSPPDPCSSEESTVFTIDADDLPEGETTFVPVATDYAGNAGVLDELGTNSLWSVSFDRIIPPKPFGLRVTGQTESSIVIKWDTVVDIAGGSGVSNYQYRVRVEGESWQKWQAVEQTHKTITSLPPDVAALIQVRARDFAKNYSKYRGGSGRPVAGAVAEVVIAGSRGSPKFNDKGGGSVPRNEYTFWSLMHGSRTYEIGMSSEVVKRGAGSVVTNTVNYNTSSWPRHLNLFLYWNSQVHLRKHRWYGVCAYTQTGKYSICNFKSWYDGKAGPSWPAFSIGHSGPSRTVYTPPGRHVNFTKLRAWPSAADVTFKARLEKKARIRY